MNDKIKNIEFLRIIGCIAIVVLHLYSKTCLSTFFPDIKLYDHLRMITSNGQKAVELFFMLSGLFFALKLNLNQSLWDFIKKKLIRFYPVAIFVVICSLILSLFGISDFNLYSNILILFNLYGTPMGANLTGCYPIGVFWYISVILWVLGIYFYMLQNFDKKKVNFIIFLSIVFCFSFLINAKGGKFNTPTKTYYYIFNSGFLRGVASIGCGYFVGEWWNKYGSIIRNTILNHTQTFLVTIIEFICVFFMINNLLFRYLKFKNDMIFIIDFILLIMLFFAQKGFISKLLNNQIVGNICANLAKYTYSIYMTHKLVFTILTGCFWTKHANLIYAHPILNIILTLSIVISFGIAVYYTIEKPCFDYLKKRYINII